MKKYGPKQMVASSRYQSYFPTLPAEIQQDVFNRMNELLAEEKEYCDKGNYAHMSQILTSIALYEVLQQHGRPEAEAYRIVSEEMWKFLDPSGMQKLARKSFFLPLMKKIVPFGFKHGSGYGWRYTWHQDDPKDEFRFECNECIYAKILGKRGLMKLVPCAAMRTSSTTGRCPIQISSAPRPFARAATPVISGSSATGLTPGTAGKEQTVSKGERT